MYRQLWREDILFFSLGGTSCKDSTMLRTSPTQLSSAYTTRQGICKSIEATRSLNDVGKFRQTLTDDEEYTNTEDPVKFGWSYNRTDSSKSLQLHKAFTVRITIITLNIFWNCSLNKNRLQLDTFAISMKYFLYRLYNKVILVVYFLRRVYYWSEINIKLKRFAAFA